MGLATIDEAVEEIRNGRMIIIVDDEDRENEGDLVCAAELVTPDRASIEIVNAVPMLDVLSCVCG